jgi:uncharacterized DUF497 family protein
MFSWDALKARKNRRKHGFPFEEAATLFSDPEALDWEDLEHGDPEQRWKRLGLGVQGRILLVVYTLRRLKNGTETIRIISARQASRKERQAYAG